MEQRENRFKKLRRINKPEAQDEDEVIESINKKLKTERNQPIVSQNFQGLYDYDSDSGSQKLNKENKENAPKRQVHHSERNVVALDGSDERKLKKMDSKSMQEEKPFSLNEKNTTDSDGNDSPLKSIDSEATSERTRLKRLKKLFDPNETKETIEEEERKDEPECPICISKIETESARINCCNHIFCFDCIKDWSERANQCPLCKKRFSKIQKYSRSGVKINEMRIKFKDQDFEEPAFEVIENTDEACYECGSASDMQRLLVCDECHFYCCHTYCCTPPLRRVPIDPWFCNFCRTDDVNEGRSVNRNRGTAQRDHTHQRRPVESASRRNNLNRSNESAVTQSIRNSLPDDSFLKQLFAAADKEQEKKRVSKKKRILDENSILKNYLKDDVDETKRRRSKSTKKRTSRKTDSSKERSRSKSAKSKKAVRRTSKSKRNSRSVKRTADKKKKTVKKKVNTKKNK